MGSFICRNILCQCSIPKLVVPVAPPSTRMSDLPRSPLSCCLSRRGHVQMVTAARLPTTCLNTGCTQRGIAPSCAMTARPASAGSASLRISKRAWAGAAAWLGLLWGGRGSCPTSSPGPPGWQVFSEQACASAHRPALQRTWPFSPFASCFAAWRSCECLSASPGCPRLMARRVCPAKQAAAGNSETRARQHLPACRRTTSQSQQRRCSRNNSRAQGGRGVCRGARH